LKKSLQIQWVNKIIKSAYLNMIEIENACLNFISTSTSTPAHQHTSTPAHQNFSPAIYTNKWLLLHLLSLLWDLDSLDQAINTS